MLLAFHDHSGAQVAAYLEDSCILKSKEQHRQLLLVRLLIHRLPKHEGLVQPLWWYGNKSLCGVA